MIWPICAESAVKPQPANQPTNQPTNTLHIYHNVFAYNCQSVVTFNACITVVMNRLTHVVFHKAV